MPSEFYIGSTCIIIVIETVVVVLGFLIWLKLIEIASILKKGKWQ